MQQQETQSQGEMRVEDYFWIIFRSRWSILAILLVALVTAFIKNDISPPVYEATAKIWIKEQDSQMPVFEDIFSLGLGRMSRMETLRELIKSRNIVEQTEAQLHLSQRPLEKHEGKFVKWISNLLGIKLNGRTKGELLTPEERRRKTVEKLLENLTVEIVRDTNVIKVTVKQAGPKYDALTRATTKKGVDDAPTRAMRIANTIALLFENSMKEDMKKSMQQAEKFADAQLVLVNQQLNEAERNLQKFESENKTISLDDEAKAIVEVRADLDQQIFQAEASKKEAEVRMQAFIQELSKTESTVLSAETLSQNPILTSLREDLTRKEIQLDSLKKRYTTTDNLEIKVLEGEVENLKNKIAAETENILSAKTTSLNPIYQKLKQDIIVAQSDVIGYDVRTAVLEQRKNSYDDKIEKWPEKKIKLLQLQQDLAMYQKIRDSLLETKQEAGMAKEAELGNVRIWDRAIEPQEPVGPKRKLNILLGALIGLTLGIALAFLRDYFDNTYTLEDVHQETEALSVSFLGVIPPMEATEEPKQRIGLMTYDVPKSHSAEAFRIVRTKLQFLDIEKPPKIILITSSTQGEGKTTIASNLAITFAQMEKKVILIDADLRRPSLHKIYSGALANPSNEVISSAESEVARDTNAEAYVDTVQTGASPSDSESANLASVSDDTSLMITDDIRKPGLSELLSMMNEKEPIEALEEIIKETEVENLHLLTSGTRPPNPSELLNSERMKNFVRLLEQEYDYVIIDSPPVRAVADPVILSTLTDCVIYVAEIAKTTKKPDIRLGLETLLEAIPSDTNSSNIGIVCNQIELQYGYGYGYGGYRYSKYGYYGRYRYSNYYNYYYYYYASDEEEEENQETKRNKKRRFLFGRNK